MSPILRNDAFKLREFHPGSTMSPRPLNEQILTRGFTQTTARLPTHSRAKAISLVDANKQERRKEKEV